MNEYDQGELVELDAQFYDEAGDVVDPGSVVIKTIDGNGNQSDQSVVRVVNIGQIKDFLHGSVYVAQVDTTPCGGTWKYRVTSTAPYQSAGKGSFTVTPTEFV
jgi:hypothetical protein